MLYDVMHVYGFDFMFAIIGLMGERPNGYVSEIKKRFNEDNDLISAIEDRYKDPNYLAPVNTAREDALLYLLASVNACALSQLIHGPDAEPDDSQIQAENLAGDIDAIQTAMFSRVWLPVENRLKSYATTYRDDDTEKDTAEALERLAGFLEA
jgi:hypothetical protein